VRLGRRIIAMKTAGVWMVMLAASLTARADFSYITTAKSSSGDHVTKHFLKGNKMKMDRGDTSTTLDFDAETATHIDNNKKTYSVTSFSEAGAQVGEGMKKSGAEITVDVKETGQRKNINGFNAHEVILTMDMDSPQARQAG